MITAAQLAAICPHAGSRIAVFLQPVNDAMIQFGITSPRRQAAFLAQCAHESTEFLYLRELASGNEYEGRSDLGNSQSGDGPLFKGGGLIQITGRYNYLHCGLAIGIDLVNHPELVTVPANACNASAWWWSTHGLNQLADENSFGTITHRVNGGYNGLDARCAYWAAALRAIAAQ